VRVCVCVCVNCHHINSFLIFPSKRSFPARLPVYACISCLGIVVACLMGIYDPALCAYERYVYVCACVCVCLCVCMHISHTLLTLSLSISLSHTHTQTQHTHTSHTHITHTHITHSIGIEYFANAAVLWWLIFTYNFHYILVKGLPSKHLEFRYHFVGWGISFFFTIVALALGRLTLQPNPLTGYVLYVCMYCMCVCVSSTIYTHTHTHFSLHTYFFTITTQW